MLDMCLGTGGSVERTITLIVFANTLPKLKKSGSNFFFLIPYSFQLN